MNSFAYKTAYLIDPKFPKPILTAMTDQVKDLEYDRSTVYPNEKIFEGRTSADAWFAWDKWIAGIMHNIVISANNDYFHYDIDHFDSRIQATRYDVGQRYGWHVDQADFGRLPRKLSMSLVLDTEFEGGELEIFSPSAHETVTFDIKPGHVCIFPSWISHQVKPVTSGTRYSLVAWMNGPEFK